ncbi:MAG: hypothetical protein ACREP7_12435 [Lysobacter sp.]
MDLFTPESALHALADAYRNHDMDSAARCRNFELEAKLILNHLERRGDAGFASADAVAQFAGVLEAKWRQAGPPQVAGVTSKVISTDHYAECFFVTSHELRSAEGRISSERLYMAQSDGRWAVLCYAPVQEAPTQAKKPWWAVWQ